MKSIIFAAGVAAAAMAVIAGSTPATAASLLFNASPSGSQTITVDGGAGVAAIKAGWFDVTGTNDQGNANYVVSTDFNRNFFVFDAVAGATSASIGIGNDPVTGLIIDPAFASVTWTLYDVTTITATELTSGTNAFGRTDVYADLGSGTAYGSVTLSGPTSFVVVAFNAAGLAALDAAALAGESFVVGGALSENLAAPGVPEPASWALLVAGFGLIGASLRRRRTGLIPS